MTILWQYSKSAVFNDTIVQQCNDTFWPVAAVWKHLVDAVVTTLLNISNLRDTSAWWYTVRCYAFVLDGDCSLSMGGYIGLIAFHGVGGECYVFDTIVDEWWCRYTCRSRYVCCCVSFGVPLTPCRLAGSRYARPFILVPSRRYDGIWSWLRWSPFYCSVTNVDDYSSHWYIVFYSLISVDYVVDTVHYYRVIIRADLEVVTCSRGLLSSEAVGGTVVTVWWLYRVLLMLLLECVVRYCYFTFIRTTLPVMIPFIDISSMILISILHPLHCEWYLWWYGVDTSI